ncbi:RecQ family ATP-dependent DNA helicase [Terriglobus saanensis]|uniref:ATP-dependent DNA helicase RecQ n=1 Tax=Terriglobus saanensis (strain ATCC BAA-1853 / DSM 23119 / SP1PR4) TaxID=401053 RepID=E8V6N8_TERSS|nr:RecQ family ATP-dependent DNA helicase [Terriglobus saanensis]ADV82777.1 ATP-dependent DNA helicase, RecQ family [Terriglobus saanensis SP1PR4]
MTKPTELASLLHQTFGFAEFRANQEAVCVAAVEGKDVLLVMPTGAGKSLCYQLPAIARGGTALVISPLIALIDDQAAKMSALGLKVGRIHSGLSREESRQVCRDYLDGTLQFLFIAPERMRVPGFAAMLAKRKLSLIAIDEAHCISQWGHDFRPDYRTLGQHLQALRPTPVMALTATATTEVQRDIVLQLGLQGVAKFIHGFRRTNLAVEVIELSKPERHAKVREMLLNPERRPAIVYAPSRKDADAMASALAVEFPAAAYHAGLDAGTRERVQKEFLAGRIEVVVATVAFGMGIDKADVRTVIHTAAPSSVESFYQEIGRAGRDGKPSRSILMYSFLDRKTHEFFLERDYPPLDTLSKIERGLSRENEIHADDLRVKLKMSMDEFAPAMDRLVAQGVASLDYSGNVALIGEDSSWRKGYEAQVNFRRSQMDRMMQFAAGSTCRMTSLILHFGDAADGARACGVCDVCAPEAALAQGFRAPDEAEEREMGRLLRCVGERGMSMRKLQEAVDPRMQMDRRDFEAMVDALARAGYVSVDEAEFRGADGKDIRYRKVTLTHEGREWEGEDLVGVVLRSVVSKASKSGKASPKKKASVKPDAVALSPSEEKVADRLREWRKGVAKELSQPAFCVFPDRVLAEIVRDMPATNADLLQVKGMGVAKVERWGAAICGVINNGAAPSVERKVMPRVVVAQAPRPLAATAPVDNLEKELKIWRMRRAKEEGVAPFLLLTEDAVRRIVMEKPSNVDALGEIDGIGKPRAEKYGAAICEIVTGHI